MQIEGPLTIIGGQINDSDISRVIAPASTPQPKMRTVLLRYGYKTTHAESFQQYGRCTKLDVPHETKPSDEGAEVLGGIQARAVHAIFLSRPAEDVSDFRIHALKIDTHHDHDTHRIE